MDPLQAAFVGGWPSSDEDGVAPLPAPRGRDGGPTVVVTTNSRVAAEWPSRVVAIPAPRAAFVFPATAERPATGQESPFVGRGTQGSPDKTIRHTGGVATYSPFSRERMR